MIEKVLDKFGKIDILVNNAGIFPFVPLTEMKEENWDKVLDINLKGIFNCTKAVFPIFSKQGKSGYFLSSKSSRFDDSS